MRGHHARVTAPQAALHLGNRVAGEAQDQEVGSGLQIVLLDEMRESASHDFRLAGSRRREHHDPRRHRCFNNLSLLVGQRGPVAHHRPGNR